MKEKRISKNLITMFIAFAILLSAGLLLLTNQTNKKDVYAATTNISSGTNWSYDEIDGVNTLTVTGSINVSDLAGFASEVENVILNISGSSLSLPMFSNVTKLMIYNWSGTSTGQFKNIFSNSKLEEIWIYNAGLVNTWGNWMFYADYTVLLVVPDEEIEAYTTKFDSISYVTATIKGLSEMEPEETGVFVDIVLPTMFVGAVFAMGVMYLNLGKKKKATIQK